MAKKISLQEIVEEIEKVGKWYGDISDEGVRKAYDQYINLIISNDVDITQQHDLYNKWNEIKNEYKR